MSLIFPKKEILYAPMLGTLGGGSVRGFGRYSGGGIVLPGEPSRLFAIHTQGTHEMDINNNWTTSHLQTTTTVRSDGNFPATMGDVGIDDEGTPWIISFYNSTATLAKVNNLSVSTTQSLGFSNCRAICSLRNNVIIFADNGNNRLRSYLLNNNGTLTHVDTYQDTARSNDVEFMCSPPDYSGSSSINVHNGNLGPYSGDCRLVAYSNGNQLSEFSVSNTGAITYVQGYSNSIKMSLTYWPNGYIVVGHDTNAWLAFDENLNFIGSSGDAMAGNTGAIAMGRDGRFYHGRFNYELSQHRPWSQNGATDIGNALTRQSSLNNNTVHTPDYVNGVICVDDYVYWTGYRSGAGWNYVRRAPTGQTPLSTGSNSATYSGTGTYTEALVSGRPNWANTDENFLLGSGW